MKFGSITEDIAYTAYGLLQSVCGDGDQLRNMAQDKCVQKRGLTSSAGYTTDSESGCQCEAACQQGEAIDCMRDWSGPSLDCIKAVKAQYSQTTESSDVLAVSDLTRHVNKALHRMAQGEAIGLHDRVVEAADSKTVVLDDETVGEIKRKIRSNCMYADDDAYLTFRAKCFEEAMHWGL